MAATIWNILPLDHHLVCSLFGSQLLLALVAFSDSLTSGFSQSLPLVYTCFNYSPCGYWTRLLIVCFPTLMPAGGAVAFSILWMFYHQGSKSASECCRNVLCIYFVISFPENSSGALKWKELVCLSPELAKGYLKILHSTLQPKFVFSVIITAIFWKLLCQAHGMLSYVSNLILTISP